MKTARTQPTAARRRPRRTDTAQGAADSRIGSSPAPAVRRGEEAGRTARQAPAADRRTARPTGRNGHRPRITDGRYLPPEPGENNPVRTTRPARPSKPSAGRTPRVVVRTDADEPKRATSPRAGRPVSQRGRRLRRNRAVTVNTAVRNRVALSVLVAFLVAALVKLTFIQGVDGQAWADQGVDQRDQTVTVPAVRGAINDRNGTPLAFTIEGRDIAVRPWSFTDDDPLTVKDKPLKATKKLRVVLTAAQKREKVADILVANLGSSISKADLLAKLTPVLPKPSDLRGPFPDGIRPNWHQDYIYVAKGVMPAQAAAVSSQLDTLWTSDAADVSDRNAVAIERQDIRQYPDGALAQAVVGTTGSGGIGRSGIESKFNSLLTGTNGSVTQQVDSAGRPIPDTSTVVTAAVNGTGITTTIDSDLQFATENSLADQVNRSKAKGGCAVIKGVSDGQIYAMACYRPGQTAAQVGNPAVSIPFEPGSVNKVVTFAAALERGVITPATQYTVPGTILMGGHVVHDAWPHSGWLMTAAGILGKSSNVGTLMIAQQVGPDAFAQELAKFGLGKKTGIELPGESAGSYPPQAQWSGTSFANLPIGQGVSMTLLQLVDMYQAIGNKGVLVAPTVIAGTTDGGVFTASTPRPTSRVMTAKTASTLLSMLGAPIQSGDQEYRGTGPSAAVNGYQVAGKTGTGQQLNPVTHAYSDSLNNGTFAGIVPADNPKFAIAIVLDAPEGGSEGGTTAAPLFHQIAAYAMRAYDVPPSTGTQTIYPLYLGPAK